jgi:tetratricopeptide (TPR) repeat protein
MDLEQGNVEAALNTFSISYDDRELLLRLATACAPHAIVRGHKDAIPFLREVVSRTPAEDELFFARAWTVMTTHLDAVAILNLDGNFPDLQESLHKALEVHRAHGNKYEEAQTLLFLDMFYRYRKELVNEEDFITAAYEMAVSLGDKRLQARALLLKTGDMPLSEHKESYEKVLKLYKEVGDAYQTSYALYLINMTVDQDDPNAPERHYQLLSEALTLAESVDGYTMIDLCQNHLGLWLCAFEEWEKADVMIRRSVALSIRLGRPIGILAWAALYSGWVSTTWGNVERGIRLTTYCLKMYPVVDVPIGYLLDKHEIHLMRSFEERQRAAVGDERFEELRREGEAMSFDELVALLKTPSA